MEERAELLLVFEAVPVAEFLPLLMTGVGVAVAEPCTPREFLHGQLGTVGRRDRAAREARSASTVTRSTTSTAAFSTTGRVSPSRARCPALPAPACGGAACWLPCGRASPCRRAADRALERDGQGAGRGTVTVCLFNTVLPLLGERLLARGVSVESRRAGRVPRRTARALLAERPPCRARRAGAPPPPRTPASPTCCPRGRCGSWHEPHRPHPRETKAPEGPVRVTIKLHATLRDGRFETQARDLPHGSSLADLLADLGIGRRSGAPALRQRPPRRTHRRAARRRHGGPVPAHRGRLSQAESEAASPSRSADSPRGRADGPRSVRPSPRAAAAAPPWARRRAARRGRSRGSRTAARGASRRCAASRRVLVVLEAG